jgi:lipopolysaccharide heptosyltransferase II
LNILVVRLRLIGDVVFTTPIIRALRQQYPQSRLVYLVEAQAAPVVEHNPHVSAVMTVEHSRGWRRIRDDIIVGRQLRRERFDLAIDLHGGPRSAWFTWASRAPVRVGYDVPGRSWMYTRVAPRPQGFRPRHAVMNQWDLLACVDSPPGRPADPEIDRVEMTVGADDHRRAAHRLTSLGVPAHHRVTIVHVSAGNPFRRWPEESFAELAADLVGVGEDCWVFVTAGPSDRQAAARVLTTARARGGRAAGRLLDGESIALGELRALMDRAALFVGGDSGPLHIAATSDVPIVGLYGPTLPVRSAPWRPRAIPTISIDGGELPCRPCDQRVCAPGDFRCLSGIAAGAVRDAARALLEARS